MQLFARPSLTHFLARFGLVATLGFGLLQAQPAGQGREGDAPSAPPVLNEPRSLAGMNLDFTRGAKLGEVFQGLSKQSGVSIILHASVSAQDLSTTADLRGMGFQRAVDTLMLQNDLFYKVMDPASLMVFKKTPQNLQEFETKAIRTFNLANAGVDTTRQTLNALMPQLRVFTDKRLNAVTALGSAGELAKAQQIVTSLDRRQGEVRLVMELIEVSHKAAVSAGLLRTVETPASPGANAVPAEQALARVMQDGNSRVLASPDLRVLSGEFGEVRTGWKPALHPEAGLAKAPKTASSGKPEPGPSALADILGARIKVKPRLHPDHEVTLDVECEITDPSKGGEPAGVSTRSLKTSVRIKDGETVVFGGLLEEENHGSLAAGARGGKDRLLVVKAVVVRAGEQ